MRKKITAEIKKQVLKLYIAGMPLVEIVRQCCVCSAIIDNIVNEKGLVRNRRQLCKKYDYAHVCELYKQGKTTREVACEIDGSRSRVAQIILESGISRKRRPRVHVLQNLAHKCPIFDVNFSSYLDGLIISDGYLSRPRGCSLGCTYKQDCVNREWLEDIKKVFAVNGVIGEIKLEKRKEIFVFRTLCYNQLASFRNRWYPGGNKQVPRDLDYFNKLFLKNWLYGDGTLLKNSTLRLCTDSFSEDDVDYLISGLNYALDVNFRKCYMGVTKSGNPKYRPSLCLKDGLIKFYEHIGGCDIDCFEYKWRKDKLKVSSVCKQCGCDFVLTSHNKLWCSHKCCNKANYLIRKERKIL